MNWHELFTYDSGTGSLIWKERPREVFSTNQTYASFISKRAGKQAGYNTIGGRLVGIDNRNHFAHRIIWEMVNGPMPEGMFIDHINGSPNDNRLCNLRLVTRSQNRHNRIRWAKNKGRIKGVYEYANNRPFSKIEVDGRLIHLGYFDTKGLAAAAYAKASLMYHGKYSLYYRKAALIHANNS